MPESLITPSTDSLVPKERDRFFEFGVIGNPLLGSWYKEEEFNLQDVSIQALQKMTRMDGQAAALYRILTLPIKAAKWDIIAEDGADKEKELVLANFKQPPKRGGMSTPISFIIGYFCRAIRDGFALMEKCYEIVDGQIIFKKWAPRDASTITFLTDETGGFNGAKQKVSYKGKLIDASIPKEKLIFFTVNKEENHLYGQSMFLPGYYHYDKKHKLYYIANLAYQLNAIPFRMGKIPEGMSPKDIQLFREFLANVGLNASGTYPQGFEVEKFEATRALADFLPLIQHHDSMMAKSVLAQFLDLGAEGKGGAYALSQDHSDLMILGLESIMNEMADVISWYGIPDLVDYNFGSGKYPKFEFHPLIDSQKQLMKDVFTAILAKISNASISDEFLLEMEENVAGELGLDIDYEEVRKVREAELQAQKDAQAQAQKQAADVMRRLGTQQNPPNPPAPGNKQPGQSNPGNKPIGLGDDFEREKIIRLHELVEEAIASIVGLE